MAPALSSTPLPAPAAALLLLLALLSSPNVPALAEQDLFAPRVLSVSADTTEATVGDVVTYTVVIEGGGGAGADFAVERFELDLECVEHTTARKSRLS